MILLTAIGVLWLCSARGQDTNIVCNSSDNYRTSDGTCNNLEHPEWGSPERPLRRYLAPDYGDGSASLRGEGKTPALPSPRAVSVSMSSVPAETEGPDISLMVMQWGQFLDHDLAETPHTTVDQCCNTGVFSEAEINSDANCRPIDVRGDEFYNQYGVECLTFVRSDPATTGSSNYREQQNKITGFIDGSQIYGSSQEDQNKLRSFNGGKLKYSESEDDEGTCTMVCPLYYLPWELNSENEPEYYAGDFRVQEQPGLTSLHTLFVRMHNHFAQELKVGHPKWKDERVFQETRRIIIALLQRITYDEFLKEVLGRPMRMSRKTGGPDEGGSSYSYKSNINPEITNVFATAAFRFGHTLIEDMFNLKTTAVLLSTSFNNYHLTRTKGTYASDFIESLPGNPSAKVDHFLAETVTQKLFAEGPAFTHGSDLFALNIQRGRDHGLPSYVKWREFCGLSPVRKFEDLENIVSKDVTSALRNIYSSVKDIDLFVGAIAEKKSDPDGAVGPTLKCLLNKQFEALRDGDRFWYENQNQPKPFNAEQLKAIRETTLSSLICMYTTAQEMQKSSMRLASSKNPKEACSSLMQNTVPQLIKSLF